MLEGRKSTNNWGYLQTTLTANKGDIYITPSEIPKSRQKNCHFMKYRFSYLF